MGFLNQHFRDVQMWSKEKQVEWLNLGGQISVLIQSLAYCLPKLFRGIFIIFNYVHVYESVGICVCEVLVPAEVWGDLKLEFQAVVSFQ